MNLTKISSLTGKELNEILSTLFEEHFSGNMGLSIDTEKGLFKLIEKIDDSENVIISEFTDLYTLIKTFIKRIAGNSGVFIFTAAFSEAKAGKLYENLRESVKTIYIADGIIEVDGKTYDISELDKIDFKAAQIGEMPENI